MLASKYADPEGLPRTPSPGKRSMADPSSPSARAVDGVESLMPNNGVVTPELRVSKPLPLTSTRVEEPVLDTNREPLSGVVANKGESADSHGSKIVQGVDTKPDLLSDPVPDSSSLNVRETANAPPQAQDRPSSSLLNTLEPNVGSKGQNILNSPSPDLILKSTPLKRLRSSKGKTCTIRIPANQGKKYSGFAIPMSPQENRARIDVFEKAGYDVRGYSFGSAASGVAAAAQEVQGRTQYPDPEDQKEQFARRQFHVSIPEKKQWDDYVKLLNEEKLRKLGVSFGDEPALPPVPAQLQARGPLSRTTTSPYPPLPFSPPIPGSSAGSQHTWQNYMPFSAPFSPAASTNNTSTGQVMSPIPQIGQAYFGQQGKQSALGFSFPAGHGPSIQRTWSQQQALQHGSQKGDSPATLPSLGKQTPEPALPSSPNEPRPHSLEEQAVASKNESYPDWDRIGVQSNQVGVHNSVKNLSEHNLHERPHIEEPKVTPGPATSHYDDVASPKPQGHRHNVSAHLEREAENAEYYPGEYVNSPGILQPKISSQQPSGFLSNDQSVPQFGQTRGHKMMPSHASNASSQLNVAAKEFIFNPGKSQPSSVPISNTAFMPSASARVAKPADATSTVSFATAHSHQGSVSLSNLNVAAPEFKPPVQKNFAFSSSWFNFARKPDPTLETIIPTAQRSKEVDQDPPKKESSIFGNLAEIIKPGKASKAVPIVKPDEVGIDDAIDGSDPEDESGRITQSSARIKKGRFNDKDGDEVPRFAEPTPEPEMAPSPAVPRDVDQKMDSKIDDPRKELGSLQHSVQEFHEDQQFKPRPLQIEYDLDVSGNMSDESNVPWHGIDGDKDTSPRNGPGNLDRDRSLAASPAASSGVEEATSTKSRAASPVTGFEQQLFPPPTNVQEDDKSHLFPSYTDANDIADYINNDNSDFGIEDTDQVQQRTPVEKHSPGSFSVAAEPPIVERDLISLSPQDSGGLVRRSLNDHSPRLASNQEDLRGSLSPIRRLNTMAEGAVSDWDDMLSPGEELKIPQQHHLSDAHMVGLVEGLLKRHLGPFERALKELGSSIDRNPRLNSPRDTRRPASSYEKSNSDADDEDEPTQELQPHKREQKADRRMDQIKSAVMEAMHSTQTGGLSQIEQEVKLRKAAELRADDVQRLLTLSEKEIALYKESANSADEKLSNVEDERDDALQRYSIVEEELRSKTLDFTAETAALENKLDEYRNSHRRWREEIESAKESRESLQDTITALQRDVGEGSKQLQDLTIVNTSLKEQLAASSTRAEIERSEWKRHNDKQAMVVQDLQDKLDDSIETQQKLRTEIDCLVVKEQEAIRANVMLEETQKAKSSLETVVNKLSEKAIEHQTIVARYEREASEAHENTVVEVQRTKRLLETDIEIANKRVENTKADLETRLHMARSELENVRKDHDSVRIRYEHYLNESIAARKEAVQEANNNHNTRLEEERARFNKALAELSGQHDRAIANAHEDKQRSDMHLGSQLKLSNAKVAHLDDKVAHLEERLSVSQSAAQAAASAAQAAKSARSAIGVPDSTSVTRSIATPAHLERISPQALRESIVVLQEQLQDREARIERLEAGSSSDDQDSDGELRQRQAEITWLREILGVRIDDLTDLVNNLQMEKFDRGAARNAAIRIKANLQMEQQERDRKTNGAKAPIGNSLPTLSDIQNFASPKAAQLASAWDNWRKNPPSLAEMRQRQVVDGTPSRVSASRPMPARTGSRNAVNKQGSSISATVSTTNAQPATSRPVMTNPMAAAAMSNANKQQPQSEAQNFLSGLMTPPTSNLRRTPSTTASGPNTARPRTPSRSFSRPGTSHSLSGSPQKESGGNTSPLMRNGDYDLDAELGQQEFDFDDDSDAPTPSLKLSPGKKNDKTERTGEKSKSGPLGGAVAAE